MQHFIRDIAAKFAILNSPHSPDIGWNLNRGISDFRISGQSLVKENFHILRTGNDIDIKLGPVTKLVKKNKTLSKNLMMTLSENYGIILIFPIYGQFEVIRKPDSGFISIKLIYRTYLYLTKTENRTKLSLTQLSHYCCE